MKKAEFMKAEINSVGTKERSVFNLRQSIKRIDRLIFDYVCRGVNFVNFHWIPEDYINKDLIVQELINAGYTVRLNEEMNPYLNEPTTRPWDVRVSWCKEEEELKNEYYRP